MVTLIFQRHRECGSIEENNVEKRMLTITILFMSAYLFGLEFTASIEDNAPPSMELIFGLGKGKVNKPAAFILDGVKSTTTG